MLVKVDHNKILHVLPLLILTGFYFILVSFRLRRPLLTDCLKGPAHPNTTYHRCLYELKIIMFITVIPVFMLSSVHQRERSHLFHQPVKKRLYSCSIFCAASYCSLECFCESLSRRYKGSFCSLRRQHQHLSASHFTLHTSHTES